MKKSVFGFLFLAFVGLVTSCSSDLDDVVSGSNDFGKSSLSGRELGENLIKSFHNSISRSSDVMDLSYPSYYGGAYLTEKGELVVNVVNKTSEEIESDLITRCGGNGVVIDVCEYSYSDLLDAAKRMDGYLLSKNNTDNPLKFYGFSVCDVENDIEVYLGDISETNVQKFKKEVLEKPFLRFVQLEEPAFQSEILTGQSIVSGVGAYGSVGFRAKRVDDHVVPFEGFVTAGHVVRQAGTYVYEDESMSTPIGCAEISQTSGDMDAAFCYSMNGYTFSNHLYSDFLSVNPELSYYLANTKVAICGRYSSSTGIVSSTYATASFKWNSLGISVTLTGIVKMTCNSRSGDSGCIVYTPDDMNIAGTLIGGVENSNPSYFMPASRIVEKYGLELY